MSQFSSCRFWYETIVLQFRLPILMVCNLIAKSFWYFYCIESTMHYMRQGSIYSTLLLVNYSNLGIFKNMSIYVFYMKFYQNYQFKKCVFRRCIKQHIANIHWTVSQAILILWELTFSTLWEEIFWPGNGIYGICLGRNLPLMTLWNTVL